MMKIFEKMLRFYASVAGVLLLAGCDTIVLSPAGDIAARQADLLMNSVWLMLIIILPVMGMTVFFAFKYRESNKKARYEPEWDHSAKLELAIWAAPLFIIVCLGAMTWVGTHLLDPYRPLSRLSAEKPLQESREPLEINVVSLDWKWLFIYPDQHIATINELVVPVDRPLHFRITSSAVMNAFYVPAMSGMIYAMPGMETKLHAVMNYAGVYDGFSANYSGAGFSKMRFKAHAVTDNEFSAWLAKVRSNPYVLNPDSYQEIKKPSENEPVRYYGRLDPDLYPRIVNMCVEPGKMCMGMMMAIDNRGGAGLAGLMLAQRLTYDRPGVPGLFGTTTKYDFSALCAPVQRLDLSRDPITSVPAATPLLSHNLVPPFSRSNQQ